MKLPLSILPRFPIGIALCFLFLGTPVEQLAADERLFGVDSVNGRLLRLDRGSGRAAAIGAVGYENVRDLAYHPHSGQLLGTDTATRQLLQINPATGESTPFLTLAAGRELFMAAIEFNPVDGQLYGLDYNSATVYRIDLVSGHLDVVRILDAPLGTAGTFTFDHDGTVFLIDTRTDVLYRLRDWSAELETVGTMSPAGHVTGLSHSADGVLYGIDPSRLALLTIGKQSAGATFLPSHGVAYITGIAAVP